MNRADEIVNRMLIPQNSTNTLAEEVENGKWGRRNVIFQKIKQTDVSDFPEMSQDELILFFTGTYQLGQAISYLAEMMDEDGNIELQYLKVNENILKFLVRSRHINKKTYKCFIDYIPDKDGCDGISRYCCDCPNGLRTIGSCSHIAAIVYYLSHGRYTSKIIKPAEILTGIFKSNDVEPVINDDSDED